MKMINDDEGEVLQHKILHRTLMSEEDYRYHPFEAYIHFTAF